MLFLVCFTLMCLWPGGAAIGQRFWLVEGRVVTSVPAIGTNPGLTTVEVEMRLDSGEMTLDTDPARTSSTAVLVGGVEWADTWHWHGAAVNTTYAVGDANVVGLSADSPFWHGVACIQVIPLYQLLTVYRTPAECAADATAGYGVGGAARRWYNRVEPFGRTSTPNIYNAKEHGDYVIITATNMSVYPATASVHSNTWYGGIMFCTIVFVGAIMEAYEKESKHKIGKWLARLRIVAHLCALQVWCVWCSHPDHHPECLYNKHLWVNDISTATVVYWLYAGIMAMLIVMWYMVEYLSAGWTPSRSLTLLVWGQLEAMCFGVFYTDSIPYHNMWRIATIAVLWVHIRRTVHTFSVTWQHFHKTTTVTTNLHRAVFLLAVGSATFAAATNFVISLLPACTNILYVLGTPPATASVMTPILAVLLITTACHDRFMPIPIKEQ